MHPFYIIRMLGGVLFLGGALIMVYNLWKTATSADLALPESAADSVRARAVAAE
jgi:cytochrome c oxidase cbb3-type subunit 1